jgi:iron complex transport system substrate-binding protein
MIKRFHILFALLLLLAGCSQREPAKLTETPERIIALAPDITEIVYALGLSNKLVGASTYCNYPEAAKKLPRVGGFGQYNFEAIVSLHPDLVLLHKKYNAEKDRLTGLGIPFLETQTEHMTNIIASIQHVGAACGAETEANRLVARIQERIARPNPAGPHPRVLITFSGDASIVEQIHAFGNDCLHNELLELAGGVNVIENNLAFSLLSKEAVIRLNPDIIIQLAPGTVAPEDPSKPWKDLKSVHAVQNNRIYVLTGDHTCIPGPRFIQILDDFASIIRPND